MVQIIAMLWEIPTVKNGKTAIGGTEDNINADSHPLFILVKYSLVKHVSVIEHEQLHIKFLCFKGGWQTYKF